MTLAIEAMVEDLHISSGASVAAPTGFRVAYFHTALAVVYVAVYLWHFSPAARVLPGAYAWGWFYRYLTFWSFTIQTYVFVTSAVKGYLPQAIPPAVDASLDDLACASFSLASQVSAFYYLLLILTGNMDEGDTSKHPLWLGLFMHVANSLIGLADVSLGEPRTFSAGSRQYLLAICAVYTGFLILGRLKTGEFPYPFLNEGSLQRGLLKVGVLALAITSVAVLCNLSGPTLQVYGRWGAQAVYSTLTSK